jgi:hypothetical protein
LGRRAGWNIDPVEWAMWSSVVTGSTKSIFGMWSSSKNNVWIVGESGTIFKWNGINVASVVSGTTSNLASICGSSELDIWSVGVEDYSKTMYHWDGMSWATNSLLSKSLNTVFCTKSGYFWATAGEGIILHKKP